MKFHKLMLCLMYEFDWKDFKFKNFKNKNNFRFLFAFGTNLIKNQ